jgi:hypothetical protein
MNKFSFALVTLFVLAAAIHPVQAFTAKSLTITLAPDGDADLDMQYDLSFIEQSAVFFKIADPAAELKNAFDTHSSEPVTVKEATSSSAVVHIPAFADVSMNHKKTTMVTPGLSFERAQQVMDEYWFAPLISPDFSPGVSTIIFPDGYKAVYYDALNLPSVSRTLKR